MILRNGILIHDFDLCKFFHSVLFLSNIDRQKISYGILIIICNKKGETLNTTNIILKQK